MLKVGYITVSERLRLAKVANATEKDSDRVVRENNPSMEVPQ